MNTPFPYHAELHINMAQVDYEGVYFVTKGTYFRRRPSFVIHVKGKFNLHGCIVNPRMCFYYDIKAMLFNNYEAISRSSSIRIIMYTILLYWFLHGGRQCYVFPEGACMQPLVNCNLACTSNV